MVALLLGDQSHILTVGIYYLIKLRRWTGIIFTHVCVDSSRTVLEHHRSFTLFISVLIAAELY